MDKPRIFLGSSGMQKKLVQALTRGLEDVAHVDPWTTSLNPGTTTLARLFELAHEVDFAAFVFARDDWTAAGLPKSPPRTPVRLHPGQCRLRGRPFRWSPRNKSNLHPPCDWREASERSPRVYSHTVRGSDELRDQSCQREASEGDRERGPRRPHRGPVVAVLPDGAHRKGAFRAEPLEDFARSERRT